MPIDAATWYDSVPDAGSRYQGDVLAGVPVVLMPPQGDGPWVLLRPSAPVTFERALAGDRPRSFTPHSENSLEERWPDDQELVLAKARRSKVLVVTQSCDLDNRKWIQVAPVSPAATLQADKLASLRINEIKYFFYLPADPPDLREECFADLSRITAVHRSYLSAASPVKRLTPLATFELQKCLADFYARPSGFNVRDTVPQTGDYICLNCFTRRAVTERAPMSAGRRFDPCPGCQADALWWKFNPGAR